MLLDKKERRSEPGDAAILILSLKRSHIGINYVFPIIQQGLGGVPGIDGLPGDQGDKVRNKTLIFPSKTWLL